MKTEQVNVNWSRLSDSIVRMKAESDDFEFIYDIHFKDLLSMLTTLGFKIQ